MERPANSYANPRSTPPVAVSPSPQDAYPPAQVARLVEQVGVKKATLPAVQTFALGLLAGAFIAFGAMYATLAMTGAALGFGPSRMLGGVAFSLGLILVVVGGAELFTGNNLIVMAWAERKVTTIQLARNWALVYVANLIGALGTALMVHWSGTLALGDGAVGESALRIADAKVGLTFGEVMAMSSHSGRPVRKPTTASSMIARLPTELPASTRSNTVGPRSARSTTRPRAIRTTAAAAANIRPFLRIG
jgi:hypothetical protein